MVQQAGSDCTRYDWITKTGNYDMACPGGLRFDHALCTCNWAHLVDCDCSNDDAEDLSSDVEE